MKKAVVFGIMILISISVLFRGLYFSYDTYGFMAGLALLSVMYFFCKISKHEPIRINKLYMLLGILLIAAASLSFIKAVNPRENLGNVLLYAELLIIFIILYDYFHDKKQQLIQWMMVPTVVVGFVAAVVGLMSLTGRFNIWEVYVESRRLSSTFQYANTAAIYFIVCGIFAITLVNTIKNSILKALFVGMGNTILFAFFMTGSRAAYLVCIPIFLLLLVIQPKGSRIRAGVSFICMLAPAFIVMRGFNASTASHDNLSAAKWLAISFVIAAGFWMLLHLTVRLIVKDRQITMPRGSGFVFAVVVVIAVALAFVFKDRLIGLLPEYIVRRVARLLEYGFNDKNVQYRLEFDRDALLLIRNNWLFGYGGGGWKAMYQVIQDHYYIAVFVHNHYLQVFVDNGILAFLSFVVLVAVSVLGALFSLIRVKGSLLKTYAAGLLCGILALAGHSAVDFNLSFVSLLLLIWVMFAASVANLPEEDGGTAVVSKRGLTLIGRWCAEITGGVGVITLIIICAALFSVYSLYFAGAYNRQIAFDYVQDKDYKQARLYYEEACRLDPGNPEYAYELAKVYRYYASNTKNEEYRDIWLENARVFSEKSVNGNKNYPAYMRLLIRIYLDTDLPLEALELSQRLITCQKYNADCYELLAASYLAAAGHYEKSGDLAKAKELLAECLEIDNDPYLHRSGILSPLDHDSKEIISRYEHSDALAAYLDEAAAKLQ